MEKNICRLPEPYPEVTSCGKDEKDIELIRPLYAGTESELTAILQYAYQHQVLEAACVEASELVMHIAMAEMHHLELLANAICVLGGNPKYVNPETKCWWNSGAVSYEQELCKALLKNLKDETDAHCAYMSAASKVSNRSLAALLRRIAADEKLHMEQFTKLINCHCRKK